MTRRVDTERSRHHITLTFPGIGVMGAELADLVATERECCGFVTWDLENRGDLIVLTIRGGIDGVDAMAESFGLPREQISSAGV